MKKKSRLFSRILNVIKNPRRYLWVYRQPLTKSPQESGIPISDLFVWRNSDDWETFFELTDICSLFDDTCIEKKYATIVFFDNNGNKIVEKKLDLVSYERNTLSLKGLLLETKEPYGTFCVFHSHIPKEVTNLGSFLAERGYVSYRFRNSPLRTYVHGNLDAVSYNKSNVIESLCSISLLSREYRLQYPLTNKATYDIAVVNPSASRRNVTCVILHKNGDIYDTYQTEIAEKGSHVFEINIVGNGLYRVVIKSKLIMARPLVFCNNDEKIDVFHG